MEAQAIEIMVDPHLEEFIEGQLDMIVQIECADADQAVMTLMNDNESQDQWPKFGINQLTIRHVFNEPAIEGKVTEKYLKKY